MFSHLTYRAFRNSNYRLYFSGQLISMIGNWMQSVVEAWLVYRLTNSGQWLGFISLTHHLPAFFISPIAGVIVDRYDRRKLLLLIQTVQMTLAFTLAALVYGGWIQPWHIAVLSALAGSTVSFEITARHAFAYDLVGKDDLPSAISLNAVIMNGSRLIGPALAGACLGKFGEAACFMMNGFSYLAVIYGLALIRLKPRQQKLVKENPVLAQFGVAVNYVLKTRAILKLLLIASFLSFVAFPFTVLLPILSKEILHGDARTLAWLTSMSGVGALLGVLTIGMKYSGDLEKSILTETALAGLSLFLLGLSRTLPVALISVFLIGYFLMAVFPKINNAIQQHVEDSLRGRVLSFYTMTFLGTVPFGSYLAGWLCDHFGVSHVAQGIGLLCAAFGFILLFRFRLRSLASGKPIRLSS